MTKTQKNKLDKLWSQLIRARTDDTCERCRRPGNNPHHIIGRRNFSVRWNPDNGICLCSGCHTLRKDSAHQDPLDFKDWIIEQRGEQWYKNLRLENNLNCMPIYTITKLYLEIKLKEYE